MFWDDWVQYLSPQQFIDFQNFKKFLIDNNIIATTSGILIAYSAWDFIQSFVGDLILPGIYFLIIGRFISNGFVSTVFEPVNKLNIPKFITRLISFSIVIIFTFLFIQFVIKNWINKNDLQNHLPMKNNRNINSQTHSNSNISGNTISTNNENVTNMIIDSNRDIYHYSNF
jgi:large-conductance mechanosensitive channel